MTSALVLSLAIASAVKARAASAAWTGLSDAAWSNTGNWDATPVPGTGDAATFNGGGNGNTTIDLGTGVTVSNVVFDTASAAAYTIGAGAVGSQTLTLGQTNGNITVNSGVVNNQTINANLMLPLATNAVAAITNNSAVLLTLAGRVIGNVTNGNGLLTVAGSGNTVIAGSISNALPGNMALLKASSGQLTIASNSVWTGNGAIGRIPATTAGFPLVAREGTLLFKGGSNFVNGELVIGGVVADGGAGQNATLIVDGSTLNLSSWFSIGRGNGVGGVSSVLMLTNSATVTAGNMSAGFNGGNAANLPKGAIIMGSNSTYTISGNGAVNFAESLGSDFTWTLNDSAQFIANGTGLKHLGQNGKSTVNLNGNSSMSLGNGVVYIGRSPTTTAFATGVVNMASSGVLSIANDLRVGGSQDNGLNRGSYGQFNISSGTVNLSSMTVGRGNNNQNQCTGEVVVNGGAVTCTNDLILGYAGTNAYGRLTINAGTVNVATTARKWLHVGRFDFVDGVVDMNGGTLNLNMGTSIRFNTSSTVAGPQGGNTFNQNGGTINFYTDNGVTPGGDGETAICLVESGNAASVNTYNLNGGTVNVPYIFSRTANGSRTFNFNGGLLRAVPSVQSPVVFMNLGAGTTLAQIRNGGAIIDSNGRDTTIMDNLQHSIIGGDNATDGGLTKLGVGVLTLAGGSTYTGPTLVKGGTLALSPSTLFYAPTPITVSNATLSVDASGGASLSATSLTLQNNATVKLNYGSLSANPTTPAITITGGLVAPGTGLTISINGIGFQPGNFTLIDYTGATLPDLSNFSLTLAPGLSATLNNNTANSSIDLVISTAPQNLTWYGTNADWDINTTFNFNNATLTYLEYGSGASTVGDAVLFDDSLFNDFVNPQFTNVNLTTALSAFPVTVDSTLPYSFSGPGSLANASSLIKSNTGSLTLATANTHTGGTLIYGGAVIITNENALGAVAGKLTLGGGELQVAANATNTSRAVSVTAASTVNVLPSSTYQVGGVISGTGGLNKTGLGTLTVAGSNGITGSLVVDQGTVRNTGNQTLPAVVRVGNTAASDGVLNISGGTFRANNNGGQFASSLIAASVAGAAGDIILSGGTLNVMQQLGLGAGQGAYAALNMTGGTLACGSYIVVGFNNDRAVYNQTAGTVTISSNLMTIAAGDTGSMGVANISGGTFTAAFGASSGIMVGERGVGTLNISGAAIVNVPTNAGLTVGPAGTQNGWDGTLNLNGGTVTANRVVKGGGNGVAKINFNGGTIKASTANGSFISGFDSATVYSGGATFDDGGFAVSIPQALQAPNGYGVASIGVSSGGAGYLDAPIVTISGGSGSNATAVATVANGVVTAVTVTCPGSGYNSGEVLSVSFDSGGSAVSLPASATVTLTASPLVSGGVTKKGAGTVNLTGTNTYSGATTVSAGTLLVTPAHLTSGTVTVASNAAFGVLATTAGTATVGNITLGSLAVDRATLSFGLTGNNPTAPPLQAGTITVNGTNNVRLAGTVTAGAIPLVKYAALAGTGVLNTNIIVPQGQTAILSNDTVNLTLYAIVSGTPGIVWSGTNSVPSLTNVWNINVVNWLAAGSPAAYLETVPPGDPVTFNDLGSGTVLVSNTVSPASVTISNSAVAYTFSGSGKISGTTALIKNGTGTATLALSGNDYSGSTVVSNGTLRLGSATAIPDGATASPVNIGPGGTLDLNGFSETINGLTGSGRIDNTSGTAAVLTLGNGNGSVNWNGTIDSAGTGGNSMIKVGTGSAVITGTNYLRSSAASQINGGSLLLTNNAMFIAPTGEFWVQQNAGTSSVVVAGATLVVSNNWFVIGRNNAAADGTLTVNSGTVQKAGANGNIVVGSLNATGKLIVNGGQVLNSAMLWLGENASAHATLELNGGLIQATQVRPNNAVASSVANFNGGMLQASGNNPTNFIDAAVTCNVQSGGAVIDDGGFAIAISAALNEDGASPGGGLTKKGAGTVYLNGINSYSGTTLVTNGILAGIGSIASPVVVGPNGKIGAGDAGTLSTLTVNSSLTIQGGAFLRVAKNGGTPTSDLITGFSSLSYGGTLVVSNATSDATPLALNDTFQVFSAAPVGSGNFTTVVGSAGPGLAFAFNPASGTVTVVGGTANYPTNITASVSGNTLTLTWPNTHQGWILQAQTNSLSTGLSGNWVDIANSDSSTQAVVNINPANPTVFFRLRSP